MSHVLVARSNGVDHMLKNGLLRTCRSPGPGLGHLLPLTLANWMTAMWLIAAIQSADLGDSSAAVADPRAAQAYSR